MSWARDEWKNDLPSIALQNIDKLEKSLEALKREKQQRSFQFDSLEAALDVQKRKCEDEKNKNNETKRELQSLAERCEDVSRSRDKISQEIQLKDSRINVLEGQLQRSKQAYDNEVLKYSKLTVELEKQQAEKHSVTTKLEKLKEERGKLIEMNDIQRQKLSSGGSVGDGMSPH